ncbi:hypothetical protein BKA56DRAFT_618628 [Ilyonectria sp. MPI-CAGE-AT-0026]|nr:hypothetical protein BKA56DRAFT_618628 [Ilyonectria sp. MPI-CAGE-AT-0026]
MTPRTMTPITKTLTIIGAIVAMFTILWYTMYTPNTGLSPEQTDKTAEATSHICKAFALAKRYQPGLTEPPNFYDWLQVSTVFDEKEVMQVLEDRNTPLMNVQMQMLGEPDDDEAYGMGRTWGRMTGDITSDSIRQMQLEINVNVAIAYVLLREEEKNIYDQVFLPLLDDQPMDEAFFRPKWDRVEEKCEDL